MKARAGGQIEFPSEDHDRITGIFQNEDIEVVRIRSHYGWPPLGG